jgi:hypothetical protein
MSILEIKLLPVLFVCFAFAIVMLADLKRMEHEMEQDTTRQDMLFKAIDDYMAQLEKDQKEFVDKACKHDLEE